MHYYYSIIWKGEKMSTIYGKARELAEAVLASDESLRLADAYELYEKNKMSKAEYDKALHDFLDVVSRVNNIFYESVGVENGSGACGGCCSTGRTDCGSLLAHDGAVLAD
jgi:hypothetical protein